MHQRDLRLRLLLRYLTEGWQLTTKLCTLDWPGTLTAYHKAVCSDWPGTLTAYHKSCVLWTDLEHWQLTTKVVCSGLTWNTDSLPQKLCALDWPGTLTAYHKSCVLWTDLEHWQRTTKLCALDWPGTLTDYHKSCVLWTDLEHWQLTTKVVCSGPTWNTDSLPQKLCTLDWPGTFPWCWWQPAWQPADSQCQKPWGSGRTRPPGHPWASAGTSPLCSPRWDRETSGTGCGTSLPPAWLVTKTE